MTEMRIPPRRDLPRAWVQTHKATLVNELALAEQSRSRKRRRFVLVLAPALVALATATGFTTYVLTREATQLESIGCFERTDLNANTAVVNSDGRSPVEICSELWRDGAFANAATPKQLAACVLESGAVAVFPSSGANTCARLGLAPLPGGYAAEARRFADLRDAIVARLGEPASGSSRGSGMCVGEGAARRIVRRELDARGYASWQIEVGGEGFTAERPCAEVAFDGTRNVVVLVPAWR